MTHIISVTNQKGGVAKTTTAVNLAAASMQDLVAMTAHLQKSGCRLIAMKGRNPEAELDQLKLERPHTLSIERVHLPELDDQRHLVIIDFT